MGAEDEGTNNNNAGKVLESVEEKQLQQAIYASQQSAQPHSSQLQYNPQQSQVCSSQLNSTAHQRLLNYT